MIEGFVGEIVTTASHEYVSAATSHGVLGSPVLIARPSSTEDVSAAIAYARTQRLDVSVRSGGHTPFSTNEGGIVIDLSGIRSVEVLDGGQVRIGSGALWGDVAKALQPHGLALSSGDTSSVGVGGLTLGGGIGWMVRQYGLTIDSMLEAEVVLASGAIVTANATSEPELFWALRGGGGNFGVVTRFTFQAHPLQGVVAGSIDFEPNALERTLRNWRDVVRDAPQELNTTFLATPSFGPDDPTRWQVLFCYGGDDVSAAMAALRPLLELPGVTGHDVGSEAYADVLVAPEVPDGAPTIVDNNAFADSFSDELIESLVDAHTKFGSAILMIRHIQGALNRVPADATAIAYRDSEVLIVSAVFLTPDIPDDASSKVNALWENVAVHATGIYGGFTNGTDPSIAELMYPPSTLARLRRAKSRYDPDNLFRRNHNLAPHLEGRP
jgi:FAD/FMN-containing dehydrogenase